MADPLADEGVNVFYLRERATNSPPCVRLNAYSAM